MRTAWPMLHFHLCARMALSTFCLHERRIPLRICRGDMRGNRQGLEVKLIVSHSASPGFTLHVTSRFSRPKYPYYSGLEGHGLGGLKLKTQQNTHAATQWFPEEKINTPLFCILCQLLGLFACQVTGVQAPSFDLTGKFGRFKASLSCQLEGCWFDVFPFIRSMMFYDFV